MITVTSNTLERWAKNHYRIVLEQMEDPRTSPVIIRSLIEKGDRFVRMAVEKRLICE